MRQLLLWAPAERIDEVSSLANDGGASHVVRLHGETADGPVGLVVLHAPNDRFDDLVEALQPVDDLRLSFQPDAVIVLEPPAEEFPEQVADVDRRGPVDVLIEGLQSLGSWTSFLGYSAVAGAVVWAGLASNTVFLLTAAMLIAPYAAPAMGAAIATARGDSRLLARSVGRYLAALAVTAAVAGILTLATGVNAVTDLMIEVSNVSAVAFLLPLSAGIAGALSYSQPDRRGPITAAGVGMLVALALAPQAGLIGSGVVLADWPMVRSSLFVIALQLLGINISAAGLLMLFGLGRSVPRARRGSTAVSIASLAATAVSIAVLLGLQVAVHPELSRESVVTRAEAAAMTVLDEHPDVLAVEANARFPRAGGVAGDLIVVEGRVVPLAAGTSAADAAFLADLVHRELVEELPGVEPRVAITFVGR